MKNRITVNTEPAIAKARSSPFVSSLNFITKPITMPEKVNLPISYTALDKFFLFSLATKKEYLKIIYQSREDFVLKIKKGRVEKPLPFKCHAEFVSASIIRMLRRASV